MLSTQRLRLSSASVNGSFKKPGRYETENPTYFIHPMHKTIQTTFIAAVLSLGAIVPSQAQIIHSYWNFNDDTDNIVAEDFTDQSIAAPSLTVSGTGTDYDDFDISTLPDFTAYNGNTYPATVSGFEGARRFQDDGDAFTIALDMSQLEDFSIRFDYRNFDGISFSAVEYSIDGGSNFTAVPGAPTSLTGSSDWGQVYTADFSSLSAVEGQSDVQFRWTGNWSSSTAGAGDTLRFDNVQIAATVIPEPATGVLMLVGLGVVLSLKRKRA